MRKVFQYYLFLTVFVGGKLYAGNASWTSSPFEQKVFVENKGQFNFNSKNFPDKILFSASVEGVEMYFTPTGLTYTHCEKELMSEKEMKKLEKRKSKEKESELKFKMEPHTVSVTWLGANPNPAVETKDEVFFYYTYQNGIKANAFKKIIFKNLYPNIDLEYILPDKGGLKYSFILRPGANPSDIKMKWSSKKIFADAFGNINFKSSFGDFIDHAPQTFYENGNSISSSFQLNGNVVSFSLDAYDNSKTIIIDPWTSSPTFTMNRAYDVNYDYNGNVYAYGSWTPTFQLAKFNNTGALQWVYNANIMMIYTAYYGDFTVDPFMGTCYLGEGCDENYPTAPPRVIKINSAGQLIDSVRTSNGPFQFEIWRMDFDLCTRHILAAGGGIGGNPAQATIFDTTMNVVTPSTPAVANLPECDVALCTIDRYSQGTVAYLLSGKRDLQQVYAPSDNVLRRIPLSGIVPSAWTTKTNYNFSELSSNNYVGVPTTGFGPPMWNATGFNGITASPNYLYTYDSDSLHRWDKSSGALLGGWHVSTLPRIVSVNGNGSARMELHWGGLDVDDCDNLYVGVGKEIKVYDVNMTLTNTISLSDTVYDLKLGVNNGINNKLYACGRGFVTEINVTLPPNSTPTVTATSTPATGCGMCDGTASVNAVQSPACAAPAPFEYSWAPGGQTTSAVSGLCPGTYTCTLSRYCKPVITQTVLITGNGVITATTNSNNTTCGNNNGNASVTVTSGNPPYTYSWNPSGATTSAVSNLAAGNYTVIVSAGGCADTVSVSIAPSTGITATAGPNPTICTGASANISATGGGTYSWTNGNSNSSITISPTATTTYSVIVTNNGCTDTASATVTVNPLPTVNVPNATVCVGGTVTLTASGGTNYSWSNGATTNPIIVSPSTTTSYNVTGTDANGCSNSTSVTVNISPPPVASATSATICAGQNASLSASGGGTYLWNTGNTNSSINVSPTVSSNYSVIVAFGSCADTAFSAVIVNPSPNLNLGNDQTICAGQSISLDAGNLGANYVWSTGETTQTINIFSVGNYWVIVAIGNCIAMDTVNTFSAPGIFLPDSSLCTTSPIMLDPGSGASSYFWSNGSTTQTISVDTAGTYYVTAMFGNCAATAVANIHGIPGGEGTLYIPNAFTPNGDHLNEIFSAKGEGIISFNMNIFDRWGNLIFVSDDVNKGWNGKIEGGHYILKKDGQDIAQEDVYIWKINYTTECFPKKPKKLIGHVSIVK